MVADLSVARALLQKGKTKIVEKEKTSLTDQLNALRVNVDTLEARRKALIFVMERDRAQEVAIRQELVELAEVKESLDGEEYHAAEQIYKDALVEACAAVRDNDLELQAVETQLKPLVEEVNVLQERVNQLVADPAGLCIPGLDLPVVDQNCDPSVAKMVEATAPEIRRLKRLVEKEDYKGAVLVAMIHTARVRRVSDVLEENKALTQFDARMIRRVLGTMGLVCQKVIPQNNGTTNTYIPCLKHDWKPQEGWTDYIANRIKDLSDHNRVPAACSLSELEEPAVEDKVSAKLIKAVMNTGLLLRTADTRVIFFGGIATKANSRNLMDWAREALKMEPTWYEGGEPAGAAQSIKNGGCDLLVIMSGFVSHKDIEYINCRIPRGFPRLILPTTSNQAFTMALAELYNLKDFEKEMNS